ncbi:MAG: tRNA-specific 2-thiouridylase MnmA [candidate division WS2 bacterium ADurb.Bin280]|uniref:tRNA-specific 2-thiouridylase MnmA n=1 Tax=candidate division WS2 bacterium ADurb.Bin280 TaxID=1852829 RepID=A0A1V5SF40_9BACT|nr:MAG: tRNA-specific 2-thiouridylase MnmA [candidate division WS2 bacterium ADurb.Bin280]
MEKVILGMSGGVDSSVALYLLKEAGFDVLAVSLNYKTWSGSKNENACCTKESIERAKRICKNFNVTHQIINVEDIFNSCVIDYFKQSLKDGQTPSPCVFCNPLVKFHSLIEYSKKMGAQKVATGHYARIRKNIDKSTNKTKYSLIKALDETKDQTYSLSFLTQDELSKTLFPLGDLTKKEVMKIANNNPKLSFYQNVKQSQDFCFLSKNELKDFVKKEVTDKKGKIIDENGNVIGEHDGLANFTIGQRKSVGLPGGPYFVLKKNKEENSLIVTKNRDLLCRKNVKLTNLNLISGESLDAKMKVWAKLRSSSKLSKATLSISGENAELDFEKAQFAPTPGQIAVFYAGDECLGGAVITD